MTFLERRATDAASPRTWCVESADPLRTLPHLVSSPKEPPPDIAATDWDMLFHAVIERLESLTRSPKVVAANPEGALRECIAALKQLRSSAPGRGSPRTE